MEPCDSFNRRQCTFLAGVQAAILTVTSTQTDVTAQIVNGFFFAGLVTDIGAAILSAASQRWFEMIRPDEAEHAYDYLKETHSETRSKEDEQPMVEEWRNSSFSQTTNVNGAASPFAVWTAFKYRGMGLACIEGPSQRSLIRICAPAHGSDGLGMVARGACRERPVHGTVCVGGDPYPIVSDPTRSQKNFDSFPAAQSLRMTYW